MYKVLAKLVDPFLTTDYVYYIYTPQGVCLGQTHSEIIAYEIVDSLNELEQLEQQ